MTNEALLAELKDRLTRTQPDWVDDYRSGEVLKTDEAAIIAACSSETIRRRAAEAAERGRPIGVLIAKAVWFISLKRLLEDIELRDGKHERMAAESRAKKLLETRSPPQLSVRSVATATA